MTGKVVRRNARQKGPVIELSRYVLLVFRSSWSKADHSMRLSVAMSYLLNAERSRADSH